MYQSFPKKSLNDFLMIIGNGNNMEESTQHVLFQMKKYYLFCFSPNKPLKEFSTFSMIFWVFLIPSDIPAAVNPLTIISLSAFK